MDNMPRMKERLARRVRFYGAKQRKVSQAVDKAYAEREAVRQEIQAKGEEVLAYLAKN
jgi:predicted nucleotide-binding protein (sugar kinase/HSP70/actin superfamily)